MSDESVPRLDPALTRKALASRFKAIGEEVGRLADLAQTLDWLGDAGKHPPHSAEQTLANTRDDVDFHLNLLMSNFFAQARNRAETTRCLDLLVSMAGHQKGDGLDALHLMRRWYELFGDESDPDGTVMNGTFPDYFAWDTYLRVCALAELVEVFPKHLEHIAGDMHGWPMIVSHHLDHREEFERVAERLGIGANYPLDVGPRKRRGKATPLLQYLEPLIWRVSVARTVLTEARVRDGTKADIWRPDRNSFFATLQPKPTPAEEVLLDCAADLPPLTKKSAREWSRQVIVPIIMLEDAGTRVTCKIAALRNIWEHRAVKSLATFQSRLHSAVTDTLQRFGRPG